VYRFERTGGGWTETMKIVQSDGVVGDQFGTSIDVSGDFLIVGADEDDTGGIGSGSAYFFTDVTGVVAACPPLLCDLNDDGVVDLTDLELLRVHLGACIGDVNFDGTVNINDFLLVLANWGCNI
jgi:hypothetical protein